MFFFPSGWLDDIKCKIQGLRFKRNRGGPVARTVTSLSLSRVSVFTKLTCHCHLKYGWFTSQIFLSLSFLLPTLFLFYFLLPPILLDIFLLYFTFIFLHLYIFLLFVLIALYFELASGEIVITLVLILQIPFWFSTRKSNGCMFLRLFGLSKESVWTVTWTGLNNYI